MKKLFSALIILVSVLMLSGCFFYVEDTSSYTPPKYDFYFNNNTDYDVRDWYLEDRNGNRKSKINDGYACPIYSREISSIKDITKGDYRLYYEYYDNFDNLHKYYTNYIELNSDTTYKLQENTFISGKPRSAKGI